MERKIGEIFEYKGEWYQCVEHSGCYGCAFEDGCSCNFKGYSYCATRSDNKHVIFKKLEKVGEPYAIVIHGDEKLVRMQEYKLYDVNFCKENTLLMYISDYKRKLIVIEVKQNKCKNKK